VVPDATKDYTIWKRSQQAKEGIVFYRQYLLDLKIYDILNLKISLSICLFYWGKKTTGGDNV